MRKVMMILAVLAAPAFGQMLEPSPPTGDGAVFKQQPKIEFESYEHEFGLIFDDQRQEHEFVFHNNGDQELEILNVKTTCGCTSAPLTKMKYAPGETGVITVKFNPARKKGKTQQRITVRSTDPERPEVTLVIYADVKRRIIIEPPVLSFVQTERGEPMTKTITVAGRGEDFKINEITFATPDLFAAEIVGEGEVVEIEGEMRRRYEVNLTLVDGAPVGRHTTRMDFKTNDPAATDIGTTISAQVSGELIATPTRLQLRNLEPGGPYTAQLRISHRARKPFHVAEVEVNPINGGTPEVLIKEINESAYRIVINGSADESARLVRGELVIRTDIPGEEVKRVQYYGNIAQKR